MSSGKKQTNSEDPEDSSEAEVTATTSQGNEKEYCFVIMPISDHPDYEPGHFDRVYEAIIRPACIAANFEPIRADEVRATNMIVVDILQKIISCKMAVCDLSSRNPNVLYELGIRQSFDLPVTLMKDDVTGKIFDIDSFRYNSYRKSLRYDEVQKAIKTLTESIEATAINKGKEVNSIVELMGIRKASIIDPVEISPDTEILLNRLNDLSQRISRIESPKTESSGAFIGKGGKESTDLFDRFYNSPNKEILKYQPIFAATLSDGSIVNVGDKVVESSSSPPRTGVVADISFRTTDNVIIIRIKFEDGKLLMYRAEDPIITKVFDK